MGLLKRSVELGLGALLLGKETAEEVVRELVESDHDSERAKAAGAELRERAKAFADEVSAALRDDLDQAIAAAGLVRRSEYDQLAARVAALEADQHLRRSSALPFESTNEF